MLPLDVEISETSIVLTEKFDPQTGEPLVAIEVELKPRDVIETFGAKAHFLRRQRAGSRVLLSGVYRPMSETLGIDPHYHGKAVRNSPFGKHALNAVIDFGSSTVAGYTRLSDGRPDAARSELLLVRAEVGKELFLTARREFAGQDKHGVFTASAASTKDVISWMAPLFSGKPYTTREMMTDVNFEPVFGKRFDALSMKERSKMQANMLKGLSAADSRAEFQSFSNFSGMISGQTVGGGLILLHGVLVDRVFREWRVKSTAQLRALQAAPDLLARANAFSHWPKDLTDKLAPITENDLSVLRRDAIKRLAVPSVVAAVMDIDKLPASVVNVRRATLFPEREAELLAELSPEEKERAIASVLKSRERLLAEVLAGRANHIDTLGSGVAALKAGSAWYKQLEVEFSRELNSPAFRSFLKPLQAQRKIDARVALSAMEQRISRTWEPAKVTALVTTWMSVPGDSHIPELVATKETARRRVSDLKWANFARDFSKQEQGWLSRGTRRVEPPLKGSTAPTTDSIRFAFAREYSMEMVGLGVANGSRANPTTAAYMGAYHLAINQLELLRSYQEPSGSWIVEINYSLKLSAGKGTILEFVSKDELAQRMIYGPVLKSFNAVPPSIKIHRFELAADGWRSSSLQEEAKQGAIRGLQTIAGNIGSLRFDPPDDW